MRIKTLSLKRLEVSARMATHLMVVKRYQSFGEFWPYYLNEHSKPLTRALHAVGSFGGIALLTLVIAIGKWWLFPLAFVPGYGLAWIGHFFVEKNRPATFTYPSWSLRAEFRKWALGMTGRLGPHLRVAGLGPEARIG